MNPNEIILKSISYVIMFISIVIILPLHLFPCFVSGFLAYEIIFYCTPLFERFIGGKRAKLLIIALIIILIIIIMILAIISMITFFENFQKNIDLTTEINHIFNDIKKRLPISFPSWLPNSAEELQEQIFNFIESNLILIQNMGHTFLHGFITLFIGLILGSIIALSNKAKIKTNTYLINQLLQRIYYLSEAFRNIVFAQIKISLINTLLTSIIILIIFPIFGKFLPFSKILILITFIFGLLPIIGNLISNIIIITSALSISLSAGGIMLLYLILIHKLEYFLNAEIIGNRIQSQPWELMLAMLTFEAVFGLEGLIAAPIYYAYLKTELRTHHLI